MPITFEPGSTRECFALGITNDEVDEPMMENLFLTLATTQDDVVVTPDSTEVDIFDDDRKKSLL